MSFTSTEDGGYNTPTSSSVYDGSMKDLSLSDSIAAHTKNCPWKGRSFIIRDPHTKLVIGLQKGYLRLVPENSGHGCGIYWLCVESDQMLLGFQNVVSGTFIGHKNNAVIFSALESLHGESESFCVRAHPDGGYVLLVKQACGFLPMQICMDRWLKVGTNKDEGVAWEFIRVKDEHAI